MVEVMAMKNYLIPPRINYKHIIILSNKYKSKKVVYHCILNDNNIEQVSSDIEKLKSELSPKEFFYFCTARVIITHDVNWKSVVELDSYYKNATVYDAVELFIEALKEVKLNDGI